MIDYMELYARAVADVGIDLKNTERFKLSVINFSLQKSDVHP